MHHELSWLDGSWNLDLALADGAEKALEHFADPSADGLEQQDPLPIPFIEDTPEVRKKTKRVYITFGRIQRLGPTPGCRACLAFTPNHTPECVARHEEAHGHASPAPTPRGQGELEELLDEAFPPGLDFDYEPSIASHDPLDDDLVPACPPPDVFPEDDPVYGVTSGMAVTVLRAMQLQCCLKIMFKSCFRNLLIRGVRSAALAPRRLQRRRIQNMAKASTIVLARMFCSSLLVPKTLILVKLNREVG